MTVALALRKKQPDDPDHQPHGQQQLKLHIVNRGADGGGTVGNNAHVHIAGQRLLEHGQKLQHPVRHADNVCTGLALHRQHDGRTKRRALARHISGKAGVFRPFDHLGHIRAEQGAAIPIPDDGVGIGVGGGQLIVGVNGAGPLRAVKAPLGVVDVGLGNGRAHVGQVSPALARALGG